MNRLIAVRIVTSAFNYNKERFVTERRSLVGSILIF